MKKIILILLLLMNSAFGSLLNKDTFWGFLSDDEKSYTETINIKIHKDRTVLLTTMSGKVRKGILEPTKDPKRFNVKFKSFNAEIIVVSSVGLNVKAFGKTFKFIYLVPQNNK